MVKVTKVAVWKIGNTYIESAKEAEKETRREIIREMLVAEENMGIGEGPADWIADNWDEISNRTKAALAGT